MSRIKITSDRTYEVLIDVNVKDELEKIERQHSKVLYIVPEVLKEYLDLSSMKHIFFTPDAEAQKNSEILISIWSHCGEIGLNRDDAIVGIGGGATTDLAGFAAATWLRGITWYAIPTTIAGAVDAAIGGKTGINSMHGKNLIGSFYSPSKVIIDLKLFETLTDRDFSAGMAEIIKCGFIKDPKIFKLLDDAKANLVELIYRSVKVKADVVSKDFKEGKLREILNYGHTLGHAIEKRENYKFRHGEAISIGLVFAAELSGIKVGLSTEVIEMHRKFLKQFNLPIEYRREAISELISIMKSDKKVRSSVIRFIGISKPGKVVWLENVSDADIQSAYERIAL